MTRPTISLRTKDGAPVQPSGGVTRIPAPEPSNTRVRRAQPAPFTRPSIQVGLSPAQRRVWRGVPAQDLGIGDVIPDVGQIQQILEDVRTPAPGTVSEPEQAVAAVEWSFTILAGDNQVTYRYNQPVWAFTHADVEAPSR